MWRRYNSVPKIHKKSSILKILTHSLSKFPQNSSELDPNSINNGSYTQTFSHTYIQCDFWEPFQIKNAEYSFFHNQMRQTERNIQRTNKNSSIQRPSLHEHQLIWTQIHVSFPLSHLQFILQTDSCAIFYLTGMCKHLTERKMQNPEPPMPYVSNVKEAHEPWLGSR